jgi:hypothetical protein
MIWALSYHLYRYLLPKASEVMRNAAMQLFKALLRQKDPHLRELLETQSRGVRSIDLLKNGFDRLLTDNTKGFLEFFKVAEVGSPSSIISAV